MRSLNLLYFALVGTQLNTIFLTCSTVITFGLFLYANRLAHSESTVTAVNYSLAFQALTIGLIAQGFFFLVTFFCYLQAYVFAQTTVLLDPLIVFKVETLLTSSFCTFNISLYGYILILLALFIGFFALLVSENKIKQSSYSFLFYFNYFLLIVYLLVSINDALGLFLCYELLLLPSFFFVYFVSYTRKALQASLYFVVWTQVGSLLVLVACVYIVSLAGDSSFTTIRAFSWRQEEGVLIYTLLFFGFGFKFPLWPFHYWLTKTHVEAPSGFSIYLSGFLVKSALFGFFTLTNLICVELNTTLFGTIAFLGAIDASLKLWGQSDLKKLVAYCTIQEMNLIVVAFVLGDTRLVVAGIMFSAAHAFLSTLMFYLVDCIYRRTHSRSVYQVQGLIHRTPNLGTAIFLMCLLYAGLPGTIKFSCEFLIFSALAESSLCTMLLLMVIMNVLGLIGFSKPWFNVIFGLPGKDLQQPIMDLSRRELYIVGFPFFSFFIFTYVAFPLI